MVCSEALLDSKVKVEELTYIKAELIQYYLSKIAQNFPGWSLRSEGEE